MTHVKNDELPIAQCPKCKQWFADYDGLGILSHESCGYCTHASITDDVCELCGADMDGWDK